VTFAPFVAIVVETKWRYRRNSLWKS
jgi:hypothetical protein